METYDYESLNLPQTTNQPRLKSAKKQHCATTRNEVLRLYQHKNTIKFASTNQYKITKKTLPTARISTTQATTQDIMNHYYSTSQQPFHLTIGKKQIKLDTLKQIFQSVRPNTIDESDLYFQLIQELKKTRTIPSNQIVFLVQFFQRQIQNKLTQKIINEEQDEKVVDHQQPILQKSTRQPAPQSDGLLDSLTSQSIFQQGQTIQLFKKNFRNSVFSLSQRKFVVSQEDIQVNATTKTLNKKSVQDSFDSTQVQQFLKEKQKNGENVMILRQIITWHKDLMRIVHTK